MESKSFTSRKPRILYRTSLGISERRDIIAKFANEIHHSVRILNPLGAEDKP